MRLIYSVSAFDTHSGKRIHLMNWPSENGGNGITRAKREAQRNGFAAQLTDYQSDPIDCGSVQ